MKLVQSQFLCPKRSLLTISYGVNFQIPFVTLSDRNMHGFCCCYLFAFSTRKGSSAGECGLELGQKWLGRLAGGALVTKDERVDYASKENRLEQIAFKTLS